MRITLITCALAAAIAANSAFAAEPSKEEKKMREKIVFEAPEKVGGMPLNEALMKRHSTRAYDTKKTIDDKTLGNLFWTAWGINRSAAERPGGPGRTAGSTRNWQCVELYAVFADGIYRYDANAHALELVVQGDHRALTGRQDFVPTAPLNILFVCDVAKMCGGEIPAGGPDKRAWVFLGTDCGLISQNIYLYCAQVGLGTVVRGMFDEAALGKLLALPEGKQVVMTQTIGWPK